MTPADPHLHLPEPLRRNAVQVWGETGRAWLDRLPHQLAACADRWSLDVGEPFVLSFHWVAPGSTTRVAGWRSTRTGGSATRGSRSGPCSATRCAPIPPSWSGCLPRV